MKETMTVHQALCDVKVAREKICDAIVRADFVCANRANAKRVNGIRQEDYEDAAKADYQRIIDLIRRTEAIKRAINQYNAEHKVMVGDKEYSVAEAIYMMQHGMESKKGLITSIQRMLSVASGKIALENGEKLESAAERNAATQFGGEKNVKTSDDYRDFINKYKEENQYVLVDPLGVKDRLSELQSEVDDFASKVDAAIQTANATTEITIEY